MNEILIVQDDPRMQKALTRIFEAECYKVTIAEASKKGLDAFHSSPPSAVILDLKLPALSGGSLCQQIKETSPSLPVIVLSARTQIADKVMLLQSGADDYVTKPFSPRELSARVRAAVRRSNLAMPSKIKSFGNVRVDVSGMEVTRAGKPIKMTAQEFKLLSFFLDSPKQVITRNELLMQVWNVHYCSTRTVDNLIVKVRQKIEEDPTCPRHLITVHRIGYKFIP